MGFVDPLGLTTWTGTGYAYSAIIGGGSIKLSYDLVSNCVNNSQIRVLINAGGFALGGGAQLAGTNSNVTFTDRNDIPDISVFEGTSYYTGIGYAFIGIGYSISGVRLGEATSYNAGGQMGWDASAYAGAGISTVISSKRIECKSKK